MRKKIAMVAALFAAMAVSVNAQKAYEGTAFFDNWYTA